MGHLTTKQRGLMNEQAKQLSIAKGFHAFSRLEHRSGRSFTGLNFLHLALNLPGNQTWHWEIPSINGDISGKDINKCTFFQATCGYTTEYPDIFHQSEHYICAKKAGIIPCGSTINHEA
jgi:hypothetical protein